MKKIIFLIISLICMISVSYAVTPQPLTVKFGLSQSALGVIAGNVFLANCYDGLQEVDGSVIDNVTPITKLSWIVPAGITCVQAGVIGGLQMYCDTSTLKATGNATIMFEVSNENLTCTCTGSACQ